MHRNSRRFVRAVCALLTVLAMGSSMADVVLCDATSSEIHLQSDRAAGTVVLDVGGDQTPPPPGIDHQCPCMHTFLHRMAVVVIGTPSAAATFRVPFACPEFRYIDRTAPPPLPPPIA